MKVIAGLLFLVAATVALSSNPCPPEQLVDWTIEKLFAHEDCGKFYQCTHGFPVPRICPAGLHFNAAKSYCDWPVNANCQTVDDETDTATDSDIVIATTETPNAIGFAAAIQSLLDKPVVVDEDDTTDVEEPATTSKPEIDFQENGCPVDPQIHWLLPDSYNCSLFYSCVWGAKVQLSCAPNLHFNRDIQVCDWPIAAGCIVAAEETSV